MKKYAVYNSNDRVIGHVYALDSEDAWYYAVKQFGKRAHDLNPSEVFKFQNI